MSSIIDSSSSILLSAELRVATTAKNVANSQISGHKRDISFSEFTERLNGESGSQQNSATIADMSQGKLSLTESPLDLAMSGPGFFQLRQGDALVYSRGGSFNFGDQGRIEDAQGRVLQSASGGDLIVRTDNPEIVADGTVLEDGVPTSSIAAFEVRDMAELAGIPGGVYQIAEGNLVSLDNSQIRQGFLEQSNTVLSDEMIDLIASVRHAETGSRIAQFYDQLIGQAITTFTRSGR